ncbi:TVP38/TMEM64 family protein [Gottfriedia luciferensis]|uniref:TVP38/TMEM64 family protein n=1 Tax=Gottfriedia luciferensis TaxID=178774 RepID=UPI000A0285D6|nr:VTT domain-containing protein [Gottfriedia luciferensis]
MKYRVITLLSSWSILLVVMYEFGIIPFSKNELIQFITDRQDYALLLFFAIFSLRFVLMIPSSLFLLTGIFLFNPWIVLLLSLGSMFITESIIFIIGKKINKSLWYKNFLNKHPKIGQRIKKNQYWMLFILGAVPTCPTDAACLISSASGMRYRPYIMIVLLSNTCYALWYVLLGRYVHLL